VAAPSNAYLSEIERFFAALRMGGFVLSPRDLELVRDWHEQGVPLGVVVRGVTEGVREWRGHATPGQRPPHALTYYRKRIRTHVRAFRRDGEAGWLTRSRPLRFIAARRAELDLLLAAEDRVPEREVKERLAGRLADLESRVAAEGLEEGAVAYELLLLDGETLQLYHRRRTGDAGALGVAGEDGLREQLRIPTLRYWSA
jgi:hypothetical protein